MDDLKITRDIVVAALNSGYPKTVASTNNNYSENYIEAVKSLIKEVHSVVSTIHSEQD